MKTLSVTEGRRRLGFWLKQAAAGLDVAFAFEGTVVALRPVDIYSEDYALREYGLTQEEMNVAAARVRREAARARRQKQTVVYERGTLKNILKNRAD